MASALHTTIRLLEAAAKQHDSVAVGFSGGKDSLAVLHLCATTFKRVVAFHKWTVPGLEVVEKHFRWAKERYGVETVQFPTNSVLHAMADGVWCDPVKELAFLLSSSEKVRLKASFAYALDVTGCGLLATGMKDSDGLKRRQFFANCRDGGDPFWRKVIHPIKEWNKRDVIAFLNSNNIPIPSAEKGSVTSGVGLDHGSLCWLHDEHPDDFKILLRWFPYAEAAIKRREWFGVNASQDEKPEEGNPRP